MDSLLLDFGTIKLHWSQVLLSLVSAFCLSSMIALVYEWTFQGLSWSRGLMQTMVLGSIITCLLMIAIGDNVARGIGIVGVAGDHPLSHQPAGSARPGVPVRCPRRRGGLRRAELHRRRLRNRPVLHHRRSHARLPVRHADEIRWTRAFPGYRRAPPSPPRWPGYSRRCRGPSAWSPCATSPRGTWSTAPTR